ncbi:DUF4097 family beta strand repeat-containing protein [Kitasatospora camelliae]|uniref:DUF4097 family beta strand repeat-containing protein n=1 Tax=Kitasatospora camelliae TaxID=3156397 RepID=A0AAU8JUG7_9ACTN
MVLVSTVLFGVAGWAYLVHQQSVIERPPYRVPISRLELDSVSAAVRIEPGPPGQVSIRQSLGWTWRRPVVAMIWEGDVLKVSVRCHRLFGLDDLGCDAELDIRLPAETEVTGSSTSGITQLRDLTGPISLKTGTGFIDLARVSGPIAVQAKSGRIQGSELFSARVEASTSSGPIELGFAHAPDAVTAIASSGPLTLSMPPGTRYKINGHSSSGSRSIDPTLADTSSPHVLDVVTSSGSVTINPRGGGVVLDHGPTR